MGFFDNLSEDQRNAGLRAMIGMGSSMLANKNQGLGAALGLGLNSGLQQFDYGMRQATEQKRYEERQQQLKDEIARRNAENLRRDAQAMLVADIQARNQRDLQQDLAETRFGYQKQLRGLISPKDQAVIETQRLRQQQIQQDLAYNEWLRGVTKEGQEEKAAAELKKLEEESKPGLLSRIYDTVTGADDDDEEAGEAKTNEPTSTATALPSLQRKLLGRGSRKKDEEVLQQIREVLANPETYHGFLPGAGVEPRQTPLINPQVKGGLVPETPGFSPSQIANTPLMRILLDLQGL